MFFFFGSIQLFNKTKLLDIVGFFSIITYIYRCTTNVGVVRKVSVRRK